MATTKKSQFKINNGTDWDTYHFETDSAQVKHKKSDGTETTVEDVLNSTLGGYMIQAGRINITPKANTPTTKRLTFPKPFKEQAIVLLTPISGVPGQKVRTSINHNLIKSFIMDDF